MDMRNLGGSGLRVSAVGVGCNNFGARVDLQGTRAVIDRAIDKGITLFDTSDNYGGRGASEALMGEALGDKRKHIVLATKFATQMDDEGLKQGASRRYIMQAVEASLKRLRTDYFDLYQQHKLDPLTPIDETLRALEDLVRQGKVRYVGCSNLPAWRVGEAAMAARALGTQGFVSIQDDYSVLSRGAENEKIPVARHFKMGLLPYYPLAGGLLSGKYTRGAALPAGSRFSLPGARTRDRFINDKMFDIVEKLDAFAKQRGHTLLELAVSWLLAQPVVSSVIAGATKPDQIDANIAAANWKMTAEEVAEINKIAPGLPDRKTSIG